MLKTQDLKDQIDQLTEQNKNLLNEIESMKKMIQDAQAKGDTQQGSGSGQGGQSQGQQQPSGNGQSQGDSSQGGQGGNPDSMNGQNGQGNPSGQGGSDGQGQGQGNSSGQSGQGQGNPSGQGSQSGQGGPSDSSGGGNSQGGQKQWTPQTSQLADQMMKIKQMIIQLESSTAQYVSGQSNKSVTQEDMVKIVLTLMDGMIDWAFDYVKTNNQSDTSAQ